MNNSTYYKMENQKFITPTMAMFAATTTLMQMSSRGYFCSSMFHLKCNSISISVHTEFDDDLTKYEFNGATSYEESTYFRENGESFKVYTLYYGC